MPHDFKKFPELTSSQMEIYYFSSPHKQITESFRAKVIKVIDGDTIIVSCDFRTFNFPIRFLGTNAPELNEPRGKAVQQWLERILLNEDVEIIINKKERVGKWGRLLGIIMHKGININEESIRSGRCTTFEKRNEGKIPNIGKILKW